jgi:hypothetical protein
VKQVGLLAQTRRGPLWRFLASTGLRRGEAVRVVQSRDVVADGALTVVRVESIPDATGKGRTKSGEWREIPLNAGAEASLDELPDRIAPVHPDTLGDWFAEDAKEAGVGGTLHRLGTRSARTWSWLGFRCAAYNYWRGTRTTRPPKCMRTSRRKGPGTR